MIKHTPYIVLFFLLNSFFAISQPNLVPNDSRLANEYYQNKEFDKAEVLYAKVYKDTKAKIYFNYYVNCLIEQKKYAKAERDIKKQIRRHKKDLAYLVDLGYLYKKQDKLEDAKKQFDKAIKKMSNQHQVSQLANNFIRRQEYDYALKTYETASKLTGREYHRELANIYTIQRKYKEMIQEYLAFLGENSRNIKIVQNQMQYYMNHDVNDEFSTILRIELLKKIQEKNSKIIYNQLFIWYYMQRKEFDKALFQAIAIDKRVGGSGKRVKDLAETALSNKDYETALEAYKYVENKGRRYGYYIEAKIGKLDVLYEKLINSETQSQEELQNLENEFKTTINSLGLSTNTIKSVVKLADIQAFYLNKAPEAQKMLEDAIAMRGLSQKLSAQCKIKLGDVLVYQDDLYLSALIYGQVEKANKENSYGNIAKLRKAKLAYYLNNFRWAKAQFDALKASTSKPVANDALYYSMLIDTNTKDDSLQTAMKIFARADLYKFQNKKDKAIAAYDTLISELPQHQLVDEAYMRKADILISQKKYIEATKMLKKIITEFSSDILADVALFKLGVIYEDNLKNTEEAVEFYKKLMLEHPDSIYVIEARERFRRIRKQ